MFTREELLRDVWGFRSMVPTRTLDSHASRLRRKLSAAGRTVFVINVWGVGYRLIDGEVDVVSAAATVAGWVAAGLAGASMLVVRRSLGSRMEAVARACHELRGPLTAARLGLSFGERVGRAVARSPAGDRHRAGPGRAAPCRTWRTWGSGGPRLRELERDRPARADDRVAPRPRSGWPTRSTRRVSWEWDGPLVTIWGDRLRLAQALGNLLANAIEHGGGHVHVRGAVGDAVARSRSPMTGRGLPAPVAELIRRPRRGRGARGRGLAIASAIAEAHGGRVAAGPSSRGATVALELPLPPAPQPQ